MSSSSNPQQRAGQQGKVAGRRLVPTGVPGFDTLLNGGLPASRLYLLEGGPGTGKTTLALQFLLQAVGQGERALYITLSETREELDAVAEAHGWSLDGIDIFELAAAEQRLGLHREVTLLHPWEIELGETVKLITDEAERVGASRVAFDSLSEMRLMAQDTLRFRRQILALKQFFAGREATILLLDDRTLNAEHADLQLHSLCHGVITLERISVDYGSTRRRLEVAKLRGVGFFEGWHDYVIRRGGIVVFPRLVAAAGRRTPVGEPVLSQVPGLDAMLDGGPRRGTTMLLAGPAGTGKSTIAMQYVAAAATRGERSLMFIFDERIGTLLKRAQLLGIDLNRHITDGLIRIEQIDPAQISPGEFGDVARRGAEAGCGLMVIDSLNGYLNSMPEERHLVLQMHEMLTYLNQHGLLTILVNPQHGLLGTPESSVDLSYIADTVMLLRYFEAGGRVRKAISVLKNRSGDHDTLIREYSVAPGGPIIGEPLVEFEGVLTGAPHYIGRQELLLDGAPPDA